MQCIFLKPTGVQCQAYAMNEARFCYLHNPDVAIDKKRDAQARGGSASAEDSLVKLEPLKITDAKAVLYILADTINRVRRVREDGTMDVKTANSIGHLASKMLEAQRVVILEDRLLALEAKLDGSEKSAKDSRFSMLIKETLDRWADDDTEATTSY
jgi:hypothetical protein